MICEHCRQNQADCHFVVQQAGYSREVHLCAHCAQVLARQYQAAMFGWRDEADQPAPPFPEIDRDFAHRRKISELRVRLQQAVDSEDYETAAQIRDEMKAASRANVPS